MEDFTLAEATEAEVRCIISTRFAAEHWAPGLMDEAVEYALAYLRSPEYSKKRRRLHQRLGDALAAKGWRVELERGVWLVEGGAGDPPRTLAIENATIWRSALKATEALAAARRFRPFLMGRLVDCWVGGDGEAPAAPDAVDERRV